MVDFGGSRCPGLGGQQSGGQKFLHSLPSLRLLLLLVVRRYRPYLSPIPSISFRPATVGGEALGAFWNVIAALPSERLTPSSLGVDAKKAHTCGSLSHSSFSPPGCRKQARRAICSASVSYLSTF